MVPVPNPPGGTVVTPVSRCHAAGTGTGTFQRQDRKTSVANAEPNDHRHPGLHSSFLKSLAERFDPGGDLSLSITYP
ncbi:unnamed protein product [Arctogadus glacialis]